MHGGFDSHAQNYQAHWSADPVAQRMREAVQSLILKNIPQGAHVLDVGCGVGCDAAWLVSQGYPVTAIDASIGMVEQTKRRVPEAVVLHAAAEKLPEQVRQPIDGVLLNFGVVNALDPILFMRCLEALIHPETVLIVVSMPRFHAAWVLRLLLQRRWQAARQRCQPEMDVDVHGVAVRTRYWNRSELQQCWPQWRCVSLQGLGMMWPPQSKYGHLSIPALERFIGCLPLLREWGDHSAMVWRQQ